ncbi:DUF4261 domain-containing protein [Lacrimispora sp. 38-1]|uniref:DUF4261 domain-containing protein n=1 Tax=Lacrimispora sp. 38-1 TaxID=3125778 RepID=UPI003CFB7CF6
MSILDKFRKKENSSLKQDLTKQEHPGSVFVIHLLMKEKCEMPSKEKMTAVMEKHLGELDCFCHDTKVAGFAPKKYKVEFKEGSMPPQLMVMECMKTDGYQIDEIAKSQMWDCENSAEILSECSYHVVATDMLAGAMANYKDRADMLMNFMEALVELYPECAAVQFQTSGKMFTRDKIINHQIPLEDRFIYFAVNVRFFNIEGTEDMLVDTLGMSTLYLPDLQYHYHGMDPNWVVNHAYNLLSYMYANDAPVKSGETVDGIADGHMEQTIQWKCQYENALIQPAREVLDICMNEYASGNREI